MIVIIDNGLFAHSIKQNLIELGLESVVISCHNLNLDEIESFQPEMIIISNGLEKKEFINNSIKVGQRFAWSLPILSIGIGAISIGILFNAKVMDTKINNINQFNINHDQRTIFSNVSDDFDCTKWCKYSLCDIAFKKTDLEVSAKHDNEIIAFRHKNLAIEGLLFDITSVSCMKGKTLLYNFIKYYLNI